MEREIKRRPLGRGIEALIPQTSFSAEQEGMWIGIGEICPSPRQPRRFFDEESISALAESIRQQGLLQPLVVRRTDSGYELIVGERRLRAAQKAGWEKVPVIVKEVSEGESLMMAVVENIQREELSPLEEAAVYRMLMEEFHLTQEQIAVKVGKSRPAVTNLLRLLHLPDPIKEEIDKGSLSAGHARTLLGVERPEAQLSLTREIIRRGLSVREAERLVARSVQQKKSQPEPVNNLFILSIAEDLSRSLGTRVRIRSGKKGGRIEIDYYSEEELDRLFHHLRREN